jgi:hypothetical protein
VPKSIAAIIFLGNLVEQKRPGKGAILRLFTTPRSSSQMVSGFPAPDITHVLNSGNQRALVIAEAQLPVGGEQRDRARGAGRFVSRGRHLSQVRMQMAKETAELALTNKKLGDKISDMTYVDLARLNSRIRDGVQGDLFKKVKGRLPLPGDVAGEIALGAAENVNVCHLNILPKAGPGS